MTILAFGRYNVLQLLTLRREEFLGGFGHLEQFCKASTKDKKHHISEKLHNA